MIKKVELKKQEKKIENKIEVKTTKAEVKNSNIITDPNITGIIKEG